MEKYILSHPIKFGDDITGFTDHFNQKAQQLRKYCEENDIMVINRYVEIMDGLPKAINIYITASHQIPKQVEDHIYNHMKLASDELLH